MNIRRTRSKDSVAQIVIHACPTHEVRVLGSIVGESVPSSDMSLEITTNNMKHSHVRVHDLLFLRRVGKQMRDSASQIFVTSTFRSSRCYRALQDAS